MSNINIYINVNYDNKVPPINGTPIDLTEFVQPKKSVDTISIDYNFKDLPIEHKTYQLCLKMYKQNPSNYAFASREFKNVCRLVKTSGKFVTQDNVSIESYPTLPLETKQMVDTIIGQFVATRLSNVFQKMFIGTRFGKFIKEMVHSKAVVSGSCILQAFYKQNYYTDYDIFVNESKSVKMLNFLRSIGISESTTESYQYGNKVDDNKKTYGGIKQQLIKSVHTFMINSYKVQLIVSTDDMTVKEFINVNFDIDICKNFFWYDSLVPSVQFNSVENLIYKRATFDVKKEPSAEKRKQKYLGRGFLIDGECAKVEPVKQIVGRVRRDPSRVHRERLVEYQNQIKLENLRNSIRSRMAAIRKKSVAKSFTGGRNINA